MTCSFSCFFQRVQARIPGSEPSGGDASMLALLRNGWVGIGTSFGLLFCGELLFFLQIDNDFV